MIAADKKKQHAKKETPRYTLDSIVTLPPPLQVSSRLLLSSPTASSPSWIPLLSFFFYLIRKLRDRGLNGAEQMKKEKQRREEEKDINTVFLLWLVLHSNIKHFLQRPKIKAKYPWLLMIILLENAHCRSWKHVIRQNCSNVSRRCVCLH